MGSGSARLDGGEAHYQRVVAELEKRGYAVEEFGSALLSPAVRAVIRKPIPPNPARWLGDGVSVSSDIIFDAKTSGASNRRTGNYAIEMRSLAAGKMLGTRVFISASETGFCVSHLSAVYEWARDPDSELRTCCGECVAVFRDSYNEQDIIEALDTYCPVQRRKGGGSSTPYILVPPAGFCEHLDRLFPCKEQLVRMDDPRLAAVTIRKFMTEPAARAQLAGLLLGDEM